MIIIRESGVDVVLTEPDEDGDYGYVCQACGGDQGDWGFQPMEDMIQAASNHAAVRCPNRTKE